MAPLSPLPSLLPSLPGLLGLRRDAEVLRELVRRRADLERHARSSLASHLTGVHAVLVQWRQPEHVRLAGLLHSAYSTEDYGFRLFGRDERARVRAGSWNSGGGPERLVFAFCACARRELLAATVAVAGGKGGLRVALPSRWQGVSVSLEARALAGVMVFHAATLAEQVALPRGSHARWLATASTFLASARAAGPDTAPAVFGGCTIVVTPEEEPRLLRGYKASAPRAGSWPLADAFAASPLGEHLVLAGVAALADRRGDEAAALGRRALAAFDAWGVAWDKRLRVERWRALAALLVRDGGGRDRELDVSAGRVRAALDGARGSPARLWSQLDAVDAFPEPERGAGSSPSLPLDEPAPDALPPRFARYIKGLRTNAERPMMQFYPGLRVQPWHDPRAFPIVAELERFASDIAAEAKAFDAARFQDEAENIGRKGRWGVLFLLEMGRRNEENLARCPATRSILEKHRTLTTHAGLMYFSCLDPRTRVAPHRGPTNVRLRCHLGLEVPSRCGIRVGGVTGAWEEGRCIVFDDSFGHEVWNESDQRRVVLILDLWHPDLTEDEIALLAGLHRYGAANGPAAERYWEKNDAALRRAREGPPGSRPGALPRIQSPISTRGSRPR